MMQFMHQGFGGKRFRAGPLGQKKGTAKVPFSHAVKRQEPVR
jgi:hypothetical protein